MWELEYEESWAPKNWCFWTVVLEKTLESPLDCKEIKSVPPKGNQSWVFIGRIDAEAETPIHWPPDAKGWLIEKDPDCWERLKAGGEGDDRGRDIWMASLTQWTWAWASFGSWWWTGKHEVLQSMGSQGVRHNWVTELNWIMIDNTYFGHLWIFLHFLFFFLFLYICFCIYYTICGSWNATVYFSTMYFAWMRIRLGCERYKKEKQQNNIALNMVEIYLSLCKGNM